MYQIIGIKNNKLYRMLNLADRSFQMVDRATCIGMAQKRLIVNATYQNGCLRGKGCNLKELNKSNVFQVKESVNASFVADALSSWVYEQDNSDLKRCFDSLIKPFNGVLYRGRILHKSMLKVGAKLYLNHGVVSWTKSQGVAENFADTHMEHAKEEKFDLQADISEYVKCILCIKSDRGTIKGVDILKELKQYEELVEGEIIELAESEVEILLGSLKQPELTIIKIEKIMDFYKLYCNIN